MTWPSDAASRAYAAAGRAVAALEEDCSVTWPVCPRRGLSCDCRLRAAFAVDAVRQLGPSLPRSCTVHVCGLGFCYTCSRISPFQNPHPYAAAAREDMQPRPGKDGSPPQVR